MSDADRRSALVVVANEVEPVVREWRLLYQREWVERGIPPHLTILFPFLPPSAIDGRTLAVLRGLFAPVEPFPYELGRVGSFPGTVWLAPDPVEPFLDLVERARRAFPDLPPYGDAEHAVIPHCTLALDEDADRLAAMVRELRERLGPRLPVRCRAVEVSLVGERADGTWLVRHAFPFAGPA